MEVIIDLSFDKKEDIDRNIETIENLVKRNLRLVDTQSLLDTKSILIAIKKYLDENF